MKVDEAEKRLAVTEDGGDYFQKMTGSPLTWWDAIAQKTILAELSRLQAENAKLIEMIDSPTYVYLRSPGQWTGNNWSTSPPQSRDFATKAEAVRFAVGLEPKLAPK